MTRRSGLTLVEVLTALFILALGVIAILTLFPLGAMHMAQAIRDNRSTESAVNADQFFRTVWKTNVVEGNGSEPFYTAMNDPDDSGPLPPALTGSSYPVLVDPMGWYARPTTSNPGATQIWVGDTRTNVARRNLLAVSSVTPASLQPKAALRLCSLMDTMGFTEGVPNPDDREQRYNWAWLVRKPNVADPHTCDMTVVVFDRRAHLHATVGAEDVLQGVARHGESSIAFSGFNQETNIRPGTWILDVTYQATPANRHANFYRVVSVTDTTVELQTPIKRDDGGTTPYAGTFVVFRGVSGVFVRPPLKASAN
jgi:hypothetical protein